MHTALSQAMELILTADRELMNIMSVTARMSLSSSLIALLLGVPMGIWLGAYRFPGQKNASGDKPHPDGHAPGGMRTSLLHAFFRHRSV
jgi:hypothetical protein